MCVASRATGASYLSGGTHIGKGLRIYLVRTKYPIKKMENPINTLVLCSRCHMIITPKTDV